MVAELRAESLEFGSPVWVREDHHTRLLGVLDCPGQEAQKVLQSWAEVSTAVAAIALLQRQIPGCAADTTRFLVGSKEHLSDAHLMNFVCSVREPRPAGLSKHFGQR